MVNSEWHAKGMRILAEFMPFFLVCDHTVMLAAFVDACQTKPKPFIFMNMWMQHPTFHGLIMENRMMPVFGTKQYVLCMKLKHLNAPLKTLNSNVYSHISERVKIAQAAYSEDMYLLMNNHDLSELKNKTKK